jgi:hypothetical protein
MSGEQIGLNLPERTEEITFILVERITNCLTSQQDYRE